MCEYCKLNVLESSFITHHQSLGRIYSFGYQGVFKQVKDSSVGLYEVRKRYKDNRQEDVEAVAEIVENMIHNEIFLAATSINKVIAYADKLIVPVLDVSSEMQSFMEIFG